MFSLTILSVLILNTSAKLFDQKEFDEGNGIEPNSVKPMTVQYEFIDRGNPLWVLSLSGDDWMVPKLRLGNRAEVENFYDNIGPTIRRRRRRPPARAKKDDPEKSTNEPPRSDDEIKKDFMKIINKFALSAMNDPYAYITHDNTHSYDSNPSIVVYIKGPYVSLAVEFGGNQWHYFINTPSVLPQWFFERHNTSDSPILIPEDVKHQFYRSLLRYLHVLFGFPV